MLGLLFYVLFFGSWLIKNYQRKQFNISSLLIFIYFLSCCSTVVLCFIQPNLYDINDITVLASLSHILLLFLFIYPLVVVGNKINICEINIEKGNMNLFSIFVIIAGLLLMCLSISSIRDVLSADNFGIARQEALNREDNSYYRYGIIGYLATIGTMTPLFALFCAFYRLFIWKKAGVTFYFLFLTSLSGVFANLSGAGRDGVVRWMMFLVVCLILFKKEFRFKLIPKPLVGLLMIILVTVIILFSLITIARFGEGEDGLASLLEYIGQPFYHYSNTFNGIGNSYVLGFSAIFPIIPGGVDPLEIARMTSFSFRTDVFTTFVGTFVLDVGFICTFLMAVGFFIFYLGFNKGKVRYFHNIVSYLIFYQVAYIGVFYFVFAMLARQLSFVLLYILSFCNFRLGKYRFV